MRELEPDDLSAYRSPFSAEAVNPECPSVEPVVAGGRIIRADLVAAARAAVFPDLSRQQRNVGANTVIMCLAAGAVAWVVSRGEPWTHALWAGGIILASFLAFLAIGALINFSVRYVDARWKWKRCAKWIEDEEYRFTEASLECHARGGRIAVSWRRFNLCHQSKEVLVLHSAKPGEDHVIPYRFFHDHSQWLHVLGLVEQRVGKKPPRSGNRDADKTGVGEAWASAPITAGRGKLTLGEAHDAAWLDGRRRRAIIGWSIFFGATMVPTVLMVAVSGRGGPWEAAMFLGIYCGVLAVLFGPARLLLEAFQRLIGDEYFCLRRFQLFGHGLLWELPLIHGESPWGSFTHQRHSDRVVLLYFSGLRGPLILARSLFSDEANWRKFLQMVDDRVPPG